MASEADDVHRRTNSQRVVVRRQLARHRTAALFCDNQRFVDQLFENVEHITSLESAAACNLLRSVQYPTAGEYGEVLKRDAAPQQTIARNST